MLDIPVELYTPTLPWQELWDECTRMEELVNADKIIRPAYKSVAGRKPYQPMTKRQERELSGGNYHKIGRKIKCIEILVNPKNA